MKEVEDFLEATGRLPRENPSRRKNPPLSAEPRLARFLRYQRRIEENLSDIQWQRLDQLAGFEWSPVESAWYVRLGEYAAFVRARSRRPSRRSIDPHERQLAEWFRNQQLRQRRGKLPHHLATDFEKLLNAVGETDKTSVHPPPKVRP
jgi:hypothetical protein